MLRKRILFVGQPFWVKHLSALLAEHAHEFADVDSAPLPGTNLSALLRLAVHSDILVRVGFRPGAFTIRGLFFDTLWTVLLASNRDKSYVYYWIGSDVAKTRTSLNTRSLSPFFRHARLCKHYAGAPWLANELATLGLPASTVLFPTTQLGYREDELTASLPEAFSLLTYIPDSRPDIYGSSMIYYAAERLPQIQFFVAGGVGKWVSASLNNLHFLGWQDNMRSCYLKVHGVARLVQHDALGATVREGMEAARHVLYTMPVPFTHHQHFGDNLHFTASLSELANRYYSGHSLLNHAGRRYALHEWDTSKLARALAGSLLAACPLLGAMP